MRNKTKAVLPEWASTIKAARRKLRLSQSELAEKLETSQWRSPAGSVANSNLPQMLAPISAAQRWAKSGMPVVRVGRRVQVSPEELNRWLGRESAGEPLQKATENSDLTAELRRGLSYVRNHRGTRSQKKVV
jgi:transcriptional regulator with XRE-family HTH domain